ncbi:protein-L-isoaspartate O-methyltransferase family protein [Corynebacterium halotolerans]|uniref:Protein-L-isoaspartate O-methyltransferase n=1 Tax=Corynebacterium halotolerans YIM 70093 = DSM 44683 TaxID=1121362 RepID=M1P601_9CORY|nr:methyltransferase domain-containing protein [Corynebacterium halotolerans]AGF72061.1 protein-L-isoaspartate(D-aspartate)O-methyltransferase [Corynebacterium halotolerans YIM 70093 = DSM 44683]
MTHGQPADRLRLRATMRDIDRTGFLPPRQRPHAGQDVPLPIGHGQTNSQPTTVATMLELLEVRAGDRVLDIGCGSGWTTALLSRLVGESGQVTGVERIPQLTEFGRDNLARLELSNAEIRQAVPEVFGLPDDGPFDRILVSAEADELPDELVDQLGAGGILVIPVAGLMIKVRLNHPGAPRVTYHGGFRFVPLLRER